VLGALKSKDAWTWLSSVVSRTTGPNDDDDDNDNGTLLAARRLSKLGAARLVMHNEGVGVEGIREITPIGHFRGDTCFTLLSGPLVPRLHSRDLVHCHPLLLPCSLQVC
jgi:hypothetical protein